MVICVYCIAARYNSYVFADVIDSKGNLVPNHAVPYIYIYTRIHRSKKVKAHSYIAQYPVFVRDRSKRFTLYFPDRPVHSDTISASLGRSSHML